MSHAARWLAVLRLAALGLAALAAVGGCERGERPRPAERLAPAAGPDERAHTRPDSDGRVGPAHAGIRCRLEAPVPILSGLPSAHAVAVAASDTSTVVVIDRDASTLLVIATRVASGARAVPVSAPGADALFALEALDGDRFVAITRAACPTELEAARCLFATLLGADGRAIGTPVPIDLPGALRTSKVAGSGDTVWIARAHEGAAPRLDRLRAGEDGLTLTTIGLGDGLPLGDRPTSILGLAIAGGSWAVLFRHGGGEDPEGGVVLATQLDEHEVEALHDTIVLDSFQWYGGALSIVAAFEFARPSFLHLGADGELRGEPRRLPPGEPLPAPFTTRRTAVLVGGGPRAAIEVRDGAGDRIGELVSVGTERFAFADIARRADGFVLATATLEPDGLAIATADLFCR